MCQAILLTCIFFYLCFFTEIPKQPYEKWILLSPRFLIHKTEFEMYAFLKDSLLKTGTTRYDAMKLLYIHISNLREEIQKGTLFQPTAFMTKSTLEPTLFIFLNIEIKKNVSKHFFFQMELKGTWEFRELHWPQVYSKLEDWRHKEKLMLKMKEMMSIVFKYEWTFKAM